VLRVEALAALSPERQVVGIGGARLGRPRVEVRGARLSLGALVVDVDVRFVDDLLLQR